MPRLSTIVPATDRPQTLDRCVAAIRAAAEAPEELIVVDRPARSGPARARNAGAARARGEVLVFVDADVVVQPDAFARIRARFAEDATLTALFGAYDDTAGDGLVSSFRNLLHHHVHVSSPGPATTFWAGIGAVRRDAFVAAGGFDERFRRPSVEDVELGMRLARDGARIELDPDVRGTHLKRLTLAEMIRTDFARRAVPWVGLLLAHGRPSRALNLGHRHRSSAALSLLLAGAALRRRPLPAAGAALGLALLNRRFYGLLARRLGPQRAFACAGLHVVHHLTAAAGVPAGLVAHLAARRRRPPGAYRSRSPRPLPPSAGPSSR